MKDKQVAAIQKEQYTTRYLRKFQRNLSNELCAYEVEEKI